MNDMNSLLKSKRRKKYALILLAIFLAAVFILSLSIENKDSKLDDSDGSISVTMEIRCDTLSQNMGFLDNPSIKDYIPEDGTILKKTVYKGEEDDTVFDVLNVLCRNNDIQLEFSYTSLYESYYIEGINYLYEFDGGPQSGWMYSVNGQFPNYGCSSYKIKDGDEIVWAYTCRGLGEDLGDTSWMEETNKEK